MQIDISTTTQELLAQLVQTGEFQDYDDAIAHLASRRLENASLPRLPEQIDLKEVIREQDIQPIADFRSLQRDFFPPDETSDQFMEAISERRQLDSPTAR